MVSVKYALWRLVRVAVAIFIAGIIAKYSDNSIYIGLAPVLSGLFKWLRDELSIDLYII